MKAVKRIDVGIQSLLMLVVLWSACCKEDWFVYASIALAGWQSISMFCNHTSNLIILMRERLYLFNTVLILTASIIAPVFVFPIMAYIMGIIVCHVLPFLSLWYWAISIREIKMQNDSTPIKLILCKTRRL